LHLNLFGAINTALIKYVWLKPRMVCNQWCVSKAEHRDHFNFLKVNSHRRIKDEDRSTIMVTTLSSDGHRTDVMTRRFYVLFVACYFFYWFRYVNCSSLRICWQVFQVLLDRQVLLAGLEDRVLPVLRDHLDHLEHLEIQDRLVCLAPLALQELPAFQEDQDSLVSLHCVGQEFKFTFRCHRWYSFSLLITEQPTTVKTFNQCSFRFKVRRLHWLQV